jgi:hypothetical protein
MSSLSKKTTTILLASAALLCTSPLAAAIRTRTSISKVKEHTAAPARKVSDSSKTLSTARNSSHKVSNTTEAHTSKGHKGRIQSVSASTKPGLRVQSFHESKLREPKSHEPKYRGQQAIDSTRTLEIQQALINEHYLNGEPTGEWDQATRDALLRFQSDNHWQTKILPDARALIKLGLGPSHQGLLNPETAAVAMPRHLGVEKSTPGGSN